MNPADFQHTHLISLQKLQAVRPLCVELYDNYLILKYNIGHIKLLNATNKFQKFYNKLLARSHS